MNRKSQWLIGKVLLLSLVVSVAALAEEQEHGSTLGDGVAVQDYEEVSPSEPTDGGSTEGKRAAAATPKPNPVYEAYVKMRRAEEQFEAVESMAKQAGYKGNYLPDNLAAEYRHVRERARVAINELDKQFKDFYGLDLGDRSMSTAQWRSTYQAVQKEKSLMEREYQRSRQPSK